MTALVKRENLIMPIGQELDQIITVCNALAKAPYYTKMGPGGVLAVYLTAREMRLPVMACLNGGLYTFDGKVSLSSNLMNYMIITAGHFVNIIHNGEDYCELEFERSDRPGRQSKFVFRFTIEEAERAGYLKKDNWKFNRKAMLFARTMSGGGKIWMPDVFMGNCYAIGELPEDNRMPEAEYEEIKPVDTAQRQVESDIEICQIASDIVVHQEPDLQSWATMNDIVPGHLKYNFVQNAMKMAAWPLETVLKWARNNPKQFEAKFLAWKEKNMQVVEV